MESLIAEVDSATEQKFNRLKEEWRRDTLATSSVTKMSMHPAYQRIIGMGPAVVPLLLRELRSDPDHWFWALGVITEENPVSEEDAGDIIRMSKAWLNWGKRNGLV